MIDEFFLRAVKIAENILFENFKHIVVCAYES